MLESLVGLPGKTHPLLLDQLHQTFPGSARVAQEGIAAAAAAGIWEDATKLAHNLKSNSGFLGLTRFARCCTEIETLARHASEGTAPTIADWQAAVDALALELQPSMDAPDALIEARRMAGKSHLAKKRGTAGLSACVRGHRCRRTAQARSPIQSGGCKCIPTGDPGMNTRKQFLATAPAFRLACALVQSGSIRHVVARTTETTSPLAMPG